MGKKKDLEKILAPSIDDVSIDKVVVADDILSKLSAIDEMAEEEPKTTSGLATSFLSSTENKKKKKKELEKQSLEEGRQKTDGFIDAISNIDWDSNPKRVVDFEDDDFLFGGKKKKKKKKSPKDKEGQIDFNKEFETEFALLKNNSATMSEVVASLKRNFDNMNGAKSSMRGIGKFQTDLTANLTTAINTQRQTILDMVNVKKTAAELNMKAKKEMGGVLDEEGNLNNTAANILKGLIRERDQFRETGNANTEILDLDENETGDGLTSELFSGLDSTERSDEVDKFLTYENQNVTISVCINDADTTDYDFIATNEAGEVIPDYPLPLKTKLQVNRSTGIAIDDFGEKYHIEWR